MDTTRSSSPASRLARPAAGLGIALLALALFAVGCASDGRDLAAPAAWQTTTTRPPPPTSAPNQEISDGGLTLTSPLFEPGGDLPTSATCLEPDQNRFPDLTWSGVPSGAQELAVTLSDQTDPTEPLLLWLMAGIDPTLDGLDAGIMPVGAFETLNDYGNPGFGTPCLDAFASGLRDLQFRVHVMDQPSGIAPGDPGNEAWDAVLARSVESASLLARIDSQG